MGLINRVLGPGLKNNSAIGGIVNSYTTMTSSNLFSIQGISNLVNTFSTINQMRQSLIHNDRIVLISQYKQYMQYILLYSYNQELGTLVKGFPFGGSTPDVINFASQALGRLMVSNSRGSLTPISSSEVATVQGFDSKDQSVGTNKSGFTKAGEFDSYTIYGSDVSNIQRESGSNTKSGFTARSKFQNQDETVVNGNGVTRKINPVLSNIHKYGYKTIDKIELASTHLWDIQITPYEHVGSGKVYVPQFPNISRADDYEESDHGIEEDPTDVVNQLNKDAIKIRAKDTYFIPAITYELSDWKQETTQINLYGSSLIELPTQLVVNKSIKMTVLESSTYDVSRYKRNYALSLVSSDNILLPYKLGCSQIDLYILDTDKRIIIKRSFLGILINVDNDHTGQDEPSALTVDLEFSIVGEIGARYYRHDNP